MTEKRTRCPACKLKTRLPGKGCPGCDYRYGPDRDALEIATEMSFLADELRHRSIESWTDEEGELVIGYEDEPLWSYLIWMTLCGLTRIDRAGLSRLLADRLQSDAMWILRQDRKGDPW